jgi:gamma-glutamyltranspeptidase/glutathione hydrolase
MKLYPFGVLNFITLSLLFTFDLPAQDRLSGKPFATRSEVIAKNGMAATNHPIATQVAIDILKQGGSAIDAAIAANAFLGFADPAMNGIGGDMFAMVWSAKDKKLYGLNASGKSPRNLKLEYFTSRKMTGIPASGALPVTVPGCVDGWFGLHEKFGKLNFENLMAPAIWYSREGIAVTEEIAEMMDYLERDLIRSYGLPQSFQWEDLPHFSKLYRKNGQFPDKGDLYTNPDLANTLEKIAKEGRSAFYEGEIATAIASHIQQLGGFLSKEDFAKHSSLWIEPVSINYRGYDIWEMPPNAQGMSVLQILNILKGYNLSDYGFGSKEHIHYFTEAKKLAYADLKTYYGDPSFNKLPIELLLSEEYAQKRRAEIRDDWSQNYGPGLESDNHTIYLTVADSEGNIISLIQSNSWLFGSLVVPPGLGFSLQNRGTGFNLQEGHINGYAPEKRPFHTIIPAFVTKDGKPYISFGLTGGDMQPQGHVQIVMNVIDFGMNLQEAGDAPRIRHAYFGEASSQNTGAIELESGFDYKTIRGLMKMGHQVKYGFERFGGYQAILYDGNFYYGASESRKDGQAAGY